MSDNNKNFYEKLAKAKLNFKPIVKNQEAQSGHKPYRYADLGAILDSTEKALLEQGLVLHSAVEDSGVKKVVATTLSDGVYSISSKFELINLEMKPTKNGIEKLNIQEVGSAITYARRYNIIALLNVVADDDDDGHSVENKPQPKPVSKPTQPAKQPVEQKEDFDLNTFNSLNAVNELTAYFKKLNNADEFKPLFAEKRKLIETLESFKNATAFNAWFTGLNVDYKKQITANHRTLLDMYMGNIK